MSDPVEFELALALTTLGLGCLVGLGFLLWPRKPYVEVDTDDKDDKDDKGC